MNLPEDIIERLRNHPQARDLDQSLLDMICDILRTIEELEEIH